MLWPYPSPDLGKLPVVWQGAGAGQVARHMVTSKSHKMRRRGHTTQHPGSNFALPTYGCWGASQELTWLAFSWLGKGLRGSGRHVIAVDSGVVVEYN